MTDPPRSLMRAAVVHTTGGAHVLRIEDAPRPTPGESEVLIAVRAAAVNPVDWKIRRGFVAVPLPTVLGMDVSGAVVASSVTDFAVGDDVFGIATSGSYAELTTASAAAIARKPPGVTYEQAAAIPVSGLTAWQGLFERGSLERGQTVLIAGAAGGVGHLAVQLARRVGATVIGTGSSRNRAFVLGLGADVFVDYTEEDVGDVVGDVDVVLDTVGGPATTSLLPTLRRGGVIVTVAYPPEQPPEARGVRVEPLVMRPNVVQLADLGELIASGALQVEIARTLPLSGAREAHELSESGHTRGKIVLTVDSASSA